MADNTLQRSYQRMMFLTDDLWDASEPHLRKSGAKRLTIRILGRPTIVGFGSISDTMLNYDDDPIGLVSD